MAREPKLNLKDHDLLIRVDQKVDNLIDSMDKLSDGMTKELADHELRINAIEKVHEELNPTEIAKTVQKNSQWINDFKITWKVLLFISSAISSIIGFILAVITIGFRFMQLK